MSMLRLSAPAKNCAKHTGEFPRIPREDLVNECSLVHFDGFIAAGIPLHVDISEGGGPEDDLYVPVHLWLSSPLENGGRVWAAMIVPLIRAFYW